MMSEKNVEKKIYRMRLVVMLLAILGLLFGIGIIEWCWRGYIPTPQEESGYCYGVETLVTTENECVFAGHTWIPAIENPINSMKGVCETPSALAIKAMGSFLTVVLLGLLFRMYQLHGARPMLSQTHLPLPSSSPPLFVSLFISIFWNLKLKLNLCMFICLRTNAPHAPPLFSLSFHLLTSSKPPSQSCAPPLITLPLHRFVSLCAFATRRQGSFSPSA